MRNKDGRRIISILYGCMNLLPEPSIMLSCGLFGQLDLERQSLFCNNLVDKKPDCVAHGKTQSM